MPQYLHQWRYKDTQVRSMVTHPQDRAEIVRVAIEAFGGKLHHLYFTFGAFDGVSISEFPDNETALACMMSIIGQGGLITLQTTILMTTEEAQEAMKKANHVLCPPLYESP